AVEDERSLLAGRDGLEAGLRGDANLQGVDAVVEREVEAVLARGAARERVDAVGEGCLDMLLSRLGDAEPAVAALLVAGVEVEAADAGGGHVGHGEPGMEQAVAGADAGGVGCEADE